MRFRGLGFGIPLIGGALVLPSACSSHDTPPSPTGTAADDFYAAKQVLWDGGIVNVCFEANPPPDPASMSLVRWTATNAWQVNSQVKLNGWGICDTESPGDGIRILFRDEAAHTTYLGKQIKGLAGGLVLNDKYQAYPAYPGVPPAVELAWATVHEFGHALGFPHEQDRADALSSSSATVKTIDGNTELDCVQRYQSKQAAAGWYDVNPYPGPPTGPLSPIGFYDHVGVMNYCNTMGRIMNWGVLSLGDLAGVQKVYGAPTGTRDINDGSDPVSSQFPQSTVNVITAGNLHPSCTGVVLATNTTTTKILTAAHCQVSSSTTVQFFPTTNGAGAAPSGTVLRASTTTPVALPGGIVCNQDVPGYPDSCIATYADGATAYADMAVLTVDAPAPSGYVPAPLGAKSSLAQAPAAPLAWGIGTGWGGAMGWAPLELDSPSDAGGFVVLEAPFQMEGDAGGPVFQYADSTVTSPNGLVLLALASQIGSCARGTQYCDSHHTTYTSLTYGPNYDWLVSQGGAPAAPALTPSEAVATFGAAQGVSSNAGPP